MLTRRMIASIVAALACSAAALPVAQGGLAISASVDSNAFLPGEPVIVYVTITNTGATAVPIPAALEPEYGHLRYAIERPGLATTEFRPWASIENDAPATLAPQASIRTQGRIFFGAAGWTFREPGVYRIQVALGAARAAPVTLTVEPATSDADRAASNTLIDSREAGYFLLFSGGDHLKAGIDVVKRVAESSTRLAGFATYALGASLAKSFASLETGAVRAPDLAQSQEWLQRADALLPDDAVFYKLDSKRLLIDVLRRRGRGVEALSLERQLRDSITNEMRLRPMAPDVRGFAQTVIK